MKELYYCAMGAAVLALLVTWVLVRANRRQDFRSAADARRRTGENRDNPDGSQVRVGPGPQFARGGKGGPNGEGGKGGVARNTGPVSSGPGYPGPQKIVEQRGPGNSVVRIYTDSSSDM